MATQVKKELVAELVEKIKKAQSVVFVDYQGIMQNCNFNSFTFLTPVDFTLTLAPEFMKFVIKTKENEML